jgi:hypothetical protein
MTPCNRRVLPVVYPMVAKLLGSPIRWVW